MTAAELKKIAENLTSHPMFTESDYAYLAAKGYTDDEIHKIWDRDRRDHRKPLNHTRKPNFMAYFGGDTTAAEISLAGF